jgi:iron complex outermembrane receptor protein
MMHFAGQDRHRARIRRAVGSVSFAALAMGVAASAFAQPAPAPDQRAASGVEEIVVTAQKREQRLQDVPLAVTAVSQNTLQVNRVTTVNDLTGLAPGLLSRQNAGSLGSPSFSMRGVFASASASSQDREISIYQDGVYVGGNRGAVFDLPDVERIEVLRGPQGTLFGRNATAGAISIITRDPTGVASGRQDFTVGNYGEFRTRTTLDTPQVGPFSAFITYVHDQRHGDVRNLGAGTVFDYTSPFTNIGKTASPKYLGSKNSNSLFASLKFQPSDDFKMIYKFDWSRASNTPEARAINVVNPNSLVGGLLSGILATQPAGGGAYGPIVFDPTNKRPDATNNAWSQPGFSRAYGHNVTTSWRISDHLSFKNITAYRYSQAYGPSTIGGLEGMEYTAAGKAFYNAPQAFLGGASFAQIFAPNGNGALPAGSYFAAYVGNSYGAEHQWSSESQLNYNSRLLTVTAGALWYHSFEKDGGLPGMAPNFSFQPIPQQLPLGNLQDTSSRTTSLAAYAQAELHLTPQLDIVAGGRVTKDKKVAGSDTGGTFVGARNDGTIVGDATDSFTFKKTKPTFSVGLNYKPMRDVLVYGKYSTAFLSGGIVGPIQFQPETVKSIEAGLKSEFFDHKLRFNLAIYQAHYQHSQSAQSGSVIADPNNPGQTLARLGVVVIDNGPLHAKGFEAEVTAAPIEGVTLGGSVGYTDAKLTDPNPLIAQGNPYLLNGVAKWIGQVYGQYQSQPVFDDATVLFRLDANYQGKYRNISNPNFRDDGEAAFAPYEFTKARWILNGRLALRDMKMGAVSAEVGVWVRNMTNNRDALYTLQFGDFLINSSYQPARTFGIDLNFKFR